MLPEAPFLSLGFVTEPTSPPGTPAARTSAAARTTLPRDLSDFLIELSIALHKHAMYPDGHPTLAPAADGVVRRVSGLLAERGQLSLGIARNQLIIEGVATDPKNAVLHELAERLHRHHLGAVQFTQGATAAEVNDVLVLLAQDADRTAEPLGLGPLTRLAQWPHVRLFPLTFDRLELVGGVEGEGEGGGGVTGGRTAQLWVGLARAALAGSDVAKAERPPEPNAFRPPVSIPEPPPGEGSLPVPGQAKPAPEDGSVAEPAAVAKAIESHERGTAYDQVIVGYLLQIANELKTAGPGAGALRKRMSRLVSALDGSTLKRLLEMGGDLSQRRQFILDASQGMAVDAVLDLVRAASGEGAPISGAMLRMLTKMGHHAERLPTNRKPVAEAELREQIGELVRGWALADPNPDGYALALQKMAQAAPTLVAAEDAQFAPEPERILKMACEVNAVGDALDRAVDVLVLQRRHSAVLDVLEGAPAPGAATAWIAARAVTPDAVHAVLSTSPVDLALLDRLIARLGPAAADPLLDVLAEAESKAVRRAILDRILRFGAEIGPKLIPRLADERWFVVRNILYLAAEMPRAPEGLSAVPFRQHADARVRREAYRLLFKDPAERTRALCTALSDAEPGLQRLALAATADGGCPAPAVALVVTIASDIDQESDLRVGAIRVLAAHGGQLALDALLRLAEIRRRSLLDTMRSVGASPEFLAALGALGAFPGDRRARARLEAAGRLKDPAVQKVVAEALKGMR
jgi:hypothetical protein